MAALARPMHGLWNAREAMHVPPTIQSAPVKRRPSGRRLLFGLLRRPALVQVRNLDTRALYAGPVVGGEYQPTETFGFGVEASLLMHYSTSSGGPAGNPARDSSNLRVGSHASLFARVYLW